MSLVGRATAHDAAALHVTGAATYVDDIPTPSGTFHLAFGMSKIAHGTIKSMDLSRVADAPSVAFVLTADDLPADNNVSPVPVPEPLLSDGTVHYNGQPLFIVAAASHAAARAAARLAEIEYEELPAVLTIDDAIAADSELNEPLVCEHGDA